MINGWRKTPKNDNDVLQNCAQLNNVTNLILEDAQDGCVSTKFSSSKQDEGKNIDSC